MPVLPMRTCLPAFPADSRCNSDPARSDSVFLTVSHEQAYLYIVVGCFATEKTSCEKQSLA